MRDQNVTMDNHQDWDVKNVFFKYKEEMFSFLWEHMKNIEEYFQALCLNRLIDDDIMDTIISNIESSRIITHQIDENEELDMTKHLLSALEATFLNSI